MTTSKEIFLNQVTRKTTKWEPYFDVYDEYFHAWKSQSPVFVEVGVAHGGSLEMWTKYFDPGAQIYGIDVQPQVSEPIPGAQIVVGDQADRNFWKNFLNQVPQIDLFLDDGGHFMHQQIITLECVWPHISENGVYICEDTHTSYMPQYTHGASETFLDYTKHLMDLMHRNHHMGRISLRNSELFQDLASVCVHDSMVILRKGRKKFDLIEVNSQ